MSFSTVELRTAILRCLVSAFVMGLLSGCQGDGAAVLPCIEVGTIDGEAISESAFFKGIIDEHGGQFTKTFTEGFVLQKRASAHQLKIDQQQYLARMELLEREMISSHGGQEAAIKHLERYGLALDDWRRITGARVSRDLLTLEIMRKAPTDDLLGRFFARKFGENGERRRVRYLLVSKNPKHQSVIAPKALEASKPAFLTKVRDALETVRADTKPVDKQSLSALFGTVPYVYETGLVASAITLKEQKTLQDQRIGKWTPIIEDERSFAIYRKRDPSEKGIAAIERISVSIDSEAIIQTLFTDELNVKARTRAETLFGQVNRGDKFTLLARTYSDHKVSKVRGGLFRVFEKANAELGEKATSQIMRLSKPGAVAMTEDAEGFHIVKLEQYTKVTLNGVRKELLSELSRRVFDEAALADFRKRLVSTSTVDIQPRLHARCSAIKGK